MPTTFIKNLTTNYTFLWLNLNHHSIVYNLPSFVLARLLLNSWLIFVVIQLQFKQDQFHLKGKIHTYNICAENYILLRFKSNNHNSIPNSVRVYTDLDLYQVFKSYLELYNSKSGKVRSIGTLTYPTITLMKKPSSQIIIFKP